MEPLFKVRIVFQHMHHQRIICSVRTGLRDLSTPLLMLASAMLPVAQAKLLDEELVNVIHTNQYWSTFAV